MKIAVDWQHTEEFWTEVEFDETDPEFIEWADGEQITPDLVLEYLNAGDQPLQPEGPGNDTSEETVALRAGAVDA